MGSVKIGKAGTRGVSRGIVDQMGQEGKWGLAGHSEGFGFYSE